MHFSKMDAYYHMATQGNSEAFDILYKEFATKARNLIKLQMRSVQIYTRNHEDFLELVDKIYFRILNEYDLSRGSFSSYVEYVLGVRFAAQVKKILTDESDNHDPIPEVFEELVNSEGIADPDQLPDFTDMVIRNFKLKIASPNKNKTRKERLRDKIITLRYGGLSYKEICETLKMDYNELRYCLELMKDDDEIINLKLELK